MAHTIIIAPAKRKKLYLAAAQAFAQFKEDCIGAASFGRPNKNEELNIFNGLCIYFIDTHDVPVYGESFRQLPELRYLMYNGKGKLKSFARPILGGDPCYIDNCNKEGADFRSTLCLLALQLLKTNTKLK